MIIEVCGPGCFRCQATKRNVLQAVKELGMRLEEDVMVTEIKDVTQISARGVIITPAVIIDGVKVSEGRIPNTEEIKKWIKEGK